MMIDLGPAETLSGNPLPLPIRKKLTGIPGFDEISDGGLPDGRLIGIMGGTGAGKTVFALQTLVSRARLLGEGGIFVSFEEQQRTTEAQLDWKRTELGLLTGSSSARLDGQRTAAARRLRLRQPLGEKE